MVDVRFRFHARFPEVPGIGDGFVQKGLAVRHEGVAGRQAGVVGFPGGRCVFGHPVGAVQVSQVTLSYFSLYFNCSYSNFAYFALFVPSSTTLLIFVFPFFSK